MDKKSLKVKIFFNLFGTYKELSWVADFYTSEPPYELWSKGFICWKSLYTAIGICYITLEQHNKCQ